MTTSKPSPSSKPVLWATMEDSLGEWHTLLSLTIVFVASQSWIVHVLGATGEKLFRLQTVCLHDFPRAVFVFANTTTTTTARTLARRMLSEWSTADIHNFERHLLLDLWFHPLVYALFLSSAIWCEWKQQKHSKNSRDQRGTARLLMAGAIIAALCDIGENLLHRDVIVRQTHEHSVVKQEQMLWEASVLATTKWAIVSMVLGWLLWGYTTATTTSTTSTSLSRQYKTTTKQHSDNRNTANDNHEQGLDSSWVGPRSQDFYNVPVHAAGLVTIQGRQIPWTITPDGTYNDPERSYVTSPYSHYIRYGRDECVLYATNAVVVYMAEVVFQILGMFLQLTHLDRVVFVNNRLLSTNMWPNTLDWSAQLVQELNAKVEEETNNFATTDGRAIVWRSIDQNSQPQLMKALQETPSCLLVPARIVNWSEYTLPTDLLRKFNFRRDVELFRQRVGWKLMEQTPIDDAEALNLPEPPIYETVTIEAHELTLEIATQIVNLYDQLYLDKYSRRNPQLTPQGVIRLAQTGFGTLDVLRLRDCKEDPRSMVAFVMLSVVDGVATGSFAGYDFERNPGQELYRLLTTMVFRALFRQGITKCHLSGGANRFKRLRGSISAVEYQAVFLEHLPWYRQLPWKIMKYVAEKIITVERAR